MSFYIGVDCGATNLRVGVFDKEGNLLATSLATSPLKFQPENFAAKVKALLASEASSFHIKEIIGIGVGTPGPLDMEKGLLLPSSNIGNTEPINLKMQFEMEFTRKVYFDRDTNLALLGEVWVGAAVGAKDVVMLTLGSGVGGAIMADGEIERGESGKAGEIGHILLGMSAVPASARGPVGSQPHPTSSLVNFAAGARWGAPLAATPHTSPLAFPDPPTCGLGHKGCLESWINSAQNLDELGTYLGYGLANVVDIFNPEKIIIGGGKLHKGDFLPRALEIMKQVGMKPAVDEVEVLYAKLGEWSGVYGGAKLIYDSNSYQI